MKLVLDTTNKTIKIEESVNLGELFEMLNKILPSEEWKEFILQTHTEIVWSSPIYIRDFQPYIHPWPGYPWYDNTPKVWMGGTTGDTQLQGNSQLQAGTYCIEG